MNEHASHSNAVGADILTPRRAMLAGIGGLAAGAFLASTANAGPLNPPAGPIASTPGPEPRIAINQTNTPGDASTLFRITQPGSYYLTGNISGEAGKSGIAISSGGVTLDLMGFDLKGVPGSGSGVFTTVASLYNIAIVNGSVRDWGGSGVNVGSNVALSGRVERVVASGNIGNGIIVGETFVVRGCSAAANALAGIAARNGCMIAECSVFSNSIGISVESCNIIVDCVARGNNGPGFSGTTGCSITNCVAQSNTADGIRVVSDCLVKNNTCDNNAGSAGIFLSNFDNRIEGNICTDNQIGMQCTGSGNFFSGNTCSGNAVNWDVVSSNVILVVNATTAGAVIGNSGGISPGSTNPYANFTY